MLLVLLLVPQIAQTSKLSKSKGEWAQSIET
jgi:hypothetical protein